MKGKRLLLSLPRLWPAIKAITGKYGVDYEDEAEKEEDDNGNMIPSWGKLSLAMC